MALQFPISVIVITEENKGQGCYTQFLTNIGVVIGKVKGHVAESNQEVHFFHFLFLFYRLICIYTGLKLLIVCKFR